MTLTHHTRRVLLDMVRLGAGVILAVGIARALNLSNSYSAGTITLITLLTSKRESLPRVCGASSRFSSPQRSRALPDWSFPGRWSVSGFR